eukprot:m.14930 g.14930  ORF g.14930 m.14930 type:complete len:67 (-) comp10378_c0_seq2:214-414(-)
MPRPAQSEALVAARQQFKAFRHKLSACRNEARAYGSCVEQNIDKIQQHVCQQQFNALMKCMATKKV